MHIHYEVLFSVKNNNIMKFAGKWLEQVKIILSEVTQTHKDRHSFFPL
jgi:filamentous hemagglutinin family protein